jgi:hypothetical protein
MLSVCICTYNRARSLARMLDTLAAQIGILDFSAQTWAPGEPGWGGARKPSF